MGIDARGPKDPRTGKRGAPYRVRYTVDGLRKTESGFATRAAAALWEAQTMVDVARGDYVDPDAGRVLFKTYAEQWLREHEGENSTRATLRSHLDAHLIPTFGDLPLKALKKPAVKAWLAGLKRRKLSASYRRGLFVTLKTISNAAVDDKLLSVSPVKGLDGPTLRSTERRFLTAAEVGQLAASIIARFRCLILLGAYTGLRIGELAGLDTDHLDLDAGTVTVQNVVERQASGGRELRDWPKSEKSVRTVKIPTPLVADLKVHVETYAARVVPGGPVMVFPDEKGRLLHDDRFRHGAWKRAVAKAKLAAPRPTPHTLRHTHAAFLIDDGESPKAVQVRMGHATIGVTYDLYGHLFPEAEDRLVAGLERRLMLLHPDLAEVDTALDEMADDDTADGPIVDHEWTTTPGND